MSALKATHFNSYEPAPYVFGELSIGGTWRHGSAATNLTVLNPYNQEPLVKLSEANVQDVDEAFKAAALSQPTWAALPPVMRADVMRRAAMIMEARHAEIVSWLIRESGSTRIKAEMEWATVRSIVLESSTLPSRVHGRILSGDFPGKENRVYRHPVGVVAVVSPWNWPLHLSARSIVPALALGNAVVSKPANETPVSGGLLLAKIFEEAGLPSGVLNVVVGPSTAIGDVFLQHPLSRVISFTGSTRVGRHVGQLALGAATIKKPMLELGGNGPLVVLDDADVERAAHVAAVSKFLHQGQICIIANRIVVMANVYEEFVQRFVDRVKRLQVGDPNDPRTVIGPIINRRQLDKLTGMVATALRQGAKQALGGEPVGQVLPPQVFVDVHPDMDLARGEIFGPIAPIIRVSDEEEAVRVANDTEAGLSSAVITADESRGVRFARRIKAGMTHVNDVTAIDMPTMPFGGEKNSGLGRFGTEGVIEAFTSEHWISVQQSDPQLPF